MERFKALQQQQKATEEEDDSEAEEEQHRGILPEQSLKKNLGCG